MPRPTGPGRSERLPGPPRPGLLIYNFDIDGDQLKPEHQEFLRQEVVPVLRRGGSVSIAGLASRSGTVSHNQALSRRRAENTLVFLEHVIPTGFLSRQVIAFGERRAAWEGQRDGTEDDRFRSVVLYVEERSVPPPDVPPVIDVTPTLPDEGVLDSVAHILEVLGKVGLGAEIFVGGALGFGAGLVGLAADALIAFAELPLAWAAGDREARYLGKRRGLRNAMQDMANAFSSPALDAIPEARWPPVPRPAPHLSPVSEASLLESDRQARQGEREGCSMAYDVVMRMERTRREQTVMIRGRRMRIRFTGRMYLRFMASAYPREGAVADAVEVEINRRLRAQGHAESAGGR